MSLPVTLWPRYIQVSLNFARTCWIFLYLYITSPILWHPVVTSEIYSYCKILLHMDELLNGVSNMAQSESAIRYHRLSATAVIPWQWRQTSDGRQRFLTKGGVFGSKVHWKGEVGAWKKSNEVVKKKEGYSIESWTLASRWSRCPTLVALRSGVVSSSIASFPLRHTLFLFYTRPFCICVLWYPRDLRLFHLSQKYIRIWKIFSSFEHIFV